MTTHIIDGTYLLQELGVDTLTGLFGADTGTQEQYLTNADSAVIAACNRAGYSGITMTTLPVAGSVALGVLQRAALRHLYQRAMLMRRTIIVPQAALDAIGDGLPQIADGTVPLPGFVPDQAGAVGGVDVQDSGTDATAATSTGTNRGTTFSPPRTAGLF